MNILVVGSGAREDAITRALHRSSQSPKIFCYGTSRNPSIQELVEDYCIGDLTNISVIVKQAENWSIDMAIIGPELPLECGLSDALNVCGIAVVGPKKQLARIETSKGFARDLMHKYRIPGLPQYKIFSSIQGIAEFLETLGPDSYVVKANGLMGGKGVKVAGEHLHSYQEALDYCDTILHQGHSLVIEEKLIGQEFSFMCFSDGNHIAPMPVIQDHKRAFEEDKGPNTGGMGSYSDANHSLPFLNPEDIQQALAINQAVIEALREETNESYVGILYGGFIATAQGIYVIEFNARFGDPEALNVLSILESDFVDICTALTEGRLEPNQIHFSSKATVCKYAVPEGYPEHPLRDVVLDVQEVKDKSHLYFAAVDSRGGILYATGSRAVAFVGVAETIAQAEAKAESEMHRIHGPLFYRKDIGTAQLINKRVDFMNRLRAL